MIEYLKFWIARHFAGILFDVVVLFLIFGFILCITLAEKFSKK